MNTLSKDYPKKGHKPFTQLICLTFYTFSLALCLLLVACGGTSPPPKPSLESEDPALVLWPRAVGGVRLSITADRNLNLFDSRPHSVQLCIYQLSSNEAFLNLSQDQDGIKTLLKAKAFDDSVKNVVRVFMQPLESTALVFDRAENAKYIGIVAGFFDSSPKHSSGIWEIQPSVHEEGTFFTTKIYSAGTIDLSLHLSSNALSEMDTNALLLAKKQGGSSQNLDQIQNDEPLEIKEDTKPENNQLQNQEQAEKTDNQGQ